MLFRIMKHKNLQLTCAIFSCNMQHTRGSEAGDVKNSNCGDTNKSKTKQDRNSFQFFSSVSKQKPLRHQQEFTSYSIPTFLNFNE